MSIQLHLFGEPSVLEARPDAEPRRINIPLRKAEALLFYVCVEGKIPRDRLKLLFWGDKDEEQASNNLRNTIYLIRKELPDNFQVERKHLALVDFVRDIDQIDRLANPANPIEKFMFDEPLRGFDNLGLPEFDEWLSVTRSAIQESIVKNLRIRIDTCYEEELTAELTEALDALLYFEPFEEDSVLELIEAYCKMGFTAKAVSLFHNFKESMKKELGIAPSKRAEDLFYKLISIDHSPADSQANHDFFCGRESELEKLLELASKDRSLTTMVLVHGEAGVGKTALVNRAVDLLNPTETSPIFSMSPNPVGEKYPYSAWSSVVSQIGKKSEDCGVEIDPVTVAILSSIFYDFMKVRPKNASAGALAQAGNPVNIGKALAGIVTDIASTTGKRPVFVIEDLHWFDNRSLLLLKAFLSELQTPGLFIMTSRPESVVALTELLYGIKTAVARNFVSLQLLPFSADDTIDFCRRALPSSIIAQKGEEFFVKQSEGLPLLLVEMARILFENPDADCSTGLEGVIMSRFDELTDLQREAITVLSIFGDGTAIENIAAVMAVDKRELTEAIEGLMRKKLVYERSKGGKLLIDFLHANIRECIYNSVPQFKKAELHESIADTLITGYAPQVWNPALSSRIRHHYSMAGRQDRVLSLHLNEMSFHVNLNHILYPLVQDRVLHSCSIPFSSREDTERKLNFVSDLLAEINSTMSDDSPQVHQMEAACLEIWGGYLINWGEYRNGRTMINRALAISREHSFDDITIYCLEHTAHHFLQTDNSTRLLSTGRELLHLAKKMGKEHHVGLALRFIGMSKLIERDFTSAEKIFRRAIELFEELSLTGHSYTLNLLAPRCYIGEMKQWCGRPQEAIREFAYCIDRCKEAGLFWGRSHFLAHAADAALDMGDWELAKSHIDEGVNLFESCSGGHCGSLLYSLKAMKDAQEGASDGALFALERGDTLSAIGKRSWCAAQYMAKAWVAKAFENGRIGGEQLESYLEYPSKDYALQAERLYQEIGANDRAAYIARTLGG